MGYSMDIRPFSIFSVPLGARVVAPGVNFWKQEVRMVVGGLLGEEGRGTCCQLPNVIVNWAQDTRVIRIVNPSI
jgi:hypothetical protein